MATRALPAALSRPLHLRSAVLAAALPPLFLHVDHQPGFTVGAGSTSIAVELSDVAVVAVLAVALAAGLRDGFAPLRRGTALWIAAGAFAAWVLAATLYGPSMLDGYPVGENLVTAAKLGEYALLAPAVPLLVRTRDDLLTPLAMLVALSVLATLVALVQFLGAEILDAWAAGRRQPSFLGHHDFAALSGAVLLLGLWGWRPRWVALGAGALGLVLAAAAAAVLGLALAVAALLVRRRDVRQGALAVALSAAVAVGVLSLRSGDVADFLRFAGDERQSEAAGVETYSHRTLLAYIGGRIFLDHPVAGVGWQGSSEPAAFEPYLADARERFPDAHRLAFPAPERRHGVQNAYLQALADLGIVGFALLAAAFAAGLALALRPPREIGTLAFLWLLLAAGLWSAQGLVTGIPLAALTWLALGLAAARV